MPFQNIRVLFFMQETVNLHQIHNRFRIVHITRKKLINLGNILCRQLFSAAHIIVFRLFLFYLREFFL